jgi:5-methylcytosine-specific restriction protein A
VPKRLKPYTPAVKTRPNAAQRGYCSAAWRRTRLAVIARDGSQCRMCKAIVSGREAHVDHIIEKPHGTDAMNNLRVLCRSCHSKRHSSLGCQG